MINNILFIGNFNSKYSSESQYYDIFTKILKKKVVKIQENTASLSVVAEKIKLDNPDMIFWVHTHNWHIPGIIGLDSLKKKYNIPVVGYHLDLWLGLQRERDLYKDNYWKVLDHFFTVDKLFSYWLNERKGYPQGYYLPAGISDFEVVTKKQIEKKRGYDVAFIGSGIYHEEYPYRLRLINFLRSTYKDRFVWFGSGSPNGTIRSEALTNLILNTKVVVGDTLCRDFSYPYYLSDRIFETIGRGGFIIHPYIKGLEDLFKIGEEVVTYKYNDFEELEKKINFYVKSEDKRLNILYNGLKRIREDHLYSKRLQYILDIINDKKN